MRGSGGVEKGTLKGAWKVGSMSWSGYKEGAVEDEGQALWKVCVCGGCVGGDASWGLDHVQCP